MSDFPKGADFDLFDWNPNPTPGSDERKITDSELGLLLFSGDQVLLTQPVKITEDGDFLQLLSDNGNLTQVLVVSNVPKSYTLEFSGYFSSPRDVFADPKNLHIFIGAMDAQASVVGLLISREDTSAGAVGLLSSIAATAVRLGPPIATLATEHFTFRVVVDFDAKKTDIYITPTILIAQAGHILRYTTGIVETEQGFDQTFLQCKGTATNGAVLQLDSLRLSSSRLTPNMRPIADAGEDKVVAVKQTVILDGRGSYDPDRLPLTYEWIISKQPEGSSIELYGMQKASGVIDPAKFTAKSSGSVGNGISVTVGSPSDSLSLEILGTAVTITPQEDEGVLITTVDLLKTALEDPTDPAYNPSVSELIIVDASDGYTLDDVLEEGSVILGGGIDSNEPVVNFTPFKKGYYEIQLVVNDGQYDSIADTVAVRADDLGLTKGYVPDTSYMWKYLPSVWNEVKDKGIYSTFMSALTQIMSGEYLKAIQYGAAKGLGSVASHFMRRWLKYDLYSSLEETLITYSQYKEYSVEPVDDPSGDPLYTSKLKCLSASLPEVGEIICDSDGKPYTVTNTEGTEHFYISDKIQKVEILDAGNRSGASRDDYDEDDLTSYFTTYYESFSYAVNSQLLLWDKVPDAPQVYEIDEAASTSLVLKLDTEIPNDLDYVQWSIIRPFTDPLTFKKGSVLQILDLDTSTIFTGDAVHIKNKDKTFPVIGKEERDILYLQVDIEDRYLVNGVYHLSQIVIDEHILSVPRLQQVIKDPDVVYQEAEDYIITDSKIVFVVPFTVEDVPEHLWAEVTIFDNDPLIEENFGILVGLPKEAYVSGELDLSYLSAVRGLYFVIFRGPVFAYVRIGSQIFFNLPFFECDGRIESIEPDYNIDRQVGRMLVRDLGIEEFTTGTGSISHDPFSLSDPTKSFRELGVLAGDIVAINKVNYEIETIDAIELLLKDAPPEGDYDYIVRRESTGLIRTYYYSTEYGLEINPDTDEAYVSNDIVERFNPVCKGVEVTDYLHEPDWFLNIIPEVQKFATFQVRVDHKLITGDRLSLAWEFVKTLKASYNHVIFVSAKTVIDELAFTDRMEYSAHVNFFDDLSPPQLPYGETEDDDPPFDSGSAVMFDDFDGEGGWHDGELDMTSKFDMMTGSGSQRLPEDELHGPGDVKAAYLDNTKKYSFGYVTDYNKRQKVHFDRSYFYGPESVPWSRRCMYIPPEGIVPMFDSMFKFDALVDKGYSGTLPAGLKGPKEVLDFLKKAVPDWENNTFLWFDLKVFTEDSHKDDDPEGPGSSDPVFTEPPWMPEPGALYLTNVHLCSVHSLHGPDGEMPSKHPEPVIETVTECEVEE